jgi:riboflavin kinase / FMN adenylyltransferase
MNVYRSLPAVLQAPAGRSLALGTFDGVHLGHREVIRRALEWGGGANVPAAVVTFDPHPLRVLRPNSPPKLITTTDVKEELIATLGVDELIVIPFTEELSRMSAEAFAGDVLADALGARHVSVGANFRFGYEARGDVALLEQMESFETEVVPLVEVDGKPVSSSRVRELLEAGAVGEAEKLLGAPFRLQGQVVEGDARGRLLDMPTANIAPAREVVLPATGIYAGIARFEGEDRPAAISIGVRPTFEEAGDLRVEAFVLDFDGDLYGRMMSLQFIERIRDEERFDSAEELVDQMHRDVARVREILC